MKRFFAAVAAAIAVLPVLVGASPAAAQTSTDGPSATTSVIGGRTATIAEFPSLAFIAAKTEEGFFSCTGTVVAPRVVLTAGHCIEKEEELAANPPSSYRVVTGLADIRQVTSANISTVSQAVFYPTFETAKQQTDAGVLVLSAPVTAPPLRIATAADAALLSGGTPLTIAGWGLTEPHAKAGPPDLRAGGLALLSPGSCKRGTRPFEPFYSTARQLCALEPNRATSGCFGDSGGPAIATGADGLPVEIGIVVSGGRDCSRTLPNIYTRVDAISSWVAAWIASAETGAPPPPTPKASPPYLSFEDAEEFGIVALRRTFHSRFTRATDGRISCKRLGWSKVRCRVSWRTGARRYRGTFTTGLTVKGYRVLIDTKVQVRGVRA
jgi:secreted trypsin-like serine protease